MWQLGGLHVCLLQLAEEWASLPVSVTEKLVSIPTRFSVALFPTSVYTLILCLCCFMSGIILSPFVTDFHPLCFFDEQFS